MSQCREALGYIGAGGRNLLRADDAVARIGIEGRAVQIECNFEAARLEIRKPVHAAVIAEIDPDRHLRRREPVIARRNAEEDNFLPRWKNAIPEQFREHFAQPWTAGENKGVGGNRVCVRNLNGVEAPLTGGRPNGRMPVRATVLNEIGDDGLYGFPGHECAAIGLENGNGAMREMNLLVSALELRERKITKRDLHLTQRFTTLFGVFVPRIREPQHADAVQEIAMRLGEKVGPEPEGTLRHPGVHFVGTVSATNDARFAAGTGAAAGRSVFVDKSNFVSGALKVVGGPSAEDACADHGVLVWGGRWRNKRASKQ